MKTPEEWIEIWSLEDHPWMKTFIEEVQKDALSDPMAQTLDQHELELVRDVADRLERHLEARTAELDAMRAKWLEARRYLRAANKGAERNAQALALATTRYWDYCDSERREKKRDENNHKTVVWNWLLLSDEEMAKKVGSIEDVTAYRHMLKALLGTSLLKHL